MHWFDKYIKEYKQYCLRYGLKGSECDGDCKWCDEFIDYMTFDIGTHNDVWPYNYDSQERYMDACSYAREADDIISDENVRWWSGDPGYVSGISSPAVDPRDFASREEYEDVLYHHLFEEAVSRHIVIPNTNFWFHAYVKFLEDSESVCCADKSILALLDELNYCENGTYEHQAVPPIDELEREIRYSSWKKPRIEPHYSRYYSYWTYPSYYHSNRPIWRRRKKYTEAQFRNDLFYHNPELLTLMNGIIHRCSVDRRYKMTKTEEYLQEYLSDVLIMAFYLRDMFGLSVEECIQNGFVGLLKGLNDKLWNEHIPGWIWDFDKELRREQYILWEVRLHMIQHSQELSDYFGFTMNRKAAKIIEAIMFERKDLCDLSANDFSIHYEDWKESKFYIEQIRSFFREKNPIGLIPPPSSTEEYLDCDAKVYRSCAIDLLKDLVKQLPDRERNCLVLRYGLEAGRPMTLEEIADAQNISRERVRQIENKAIALLKKMPGYADLCELTDNPIPEGAKHLPQKPRKKVVTAPKPIPSALPTSQDVLRFQQNLEALQCIPSRISNQSIDDIGLSVRARNCLIRADIHTIKDLLALNKSEILHIRNLGKSSIIEISQLLASLGLNNTHWNHAQWERYYDDCSKYGFEKPRKWLENGMYDVPMPTNRRKIANFTGFYPSFYLPLADRDIIYLDQLMALDIDQLTEIAEISLLQWHKAVTYLHTLGFTPSQNLVQLARKYRPPTNTWIITCDFPTKVERRLLRNKIRELDQLMSMSVAELQQYTDITTELWQLVDRQIRSLGFVPSEDIMELAGTTYASTIANSDQTQPLSEAELTKLSVDVLAISVRTINCLKKVGITTLGALLEKGSRQLIQIKNMTPQGYGELVIELSRWGLLSSLKP